MKGKVFVVKEGLCGRAIESEKAGKFFRLAELGALAVPLARFMVKQPCRRPPILPYVLRLVEIFIYNVR